MWRRVVLREWRKNLVDGYFPNIYQHVGICEPLHCSNLIALWCWDTIQTQGFSSIILFENFLIRHRCHSVIVELEPSGVTVGFDESEVMATVQVARVDQDTM